MEVGWYLEGEGKKNMQKSEGKKEGVFISTVN